MITDIPTRAEFQKAALSQIHLAWEITMQAVHDFDDAEHFKLPDETPEEANAEFWRRSQPALANAFALIQQGMELALKGRIAAVTPYLLLGNPGDWGSSAASGPISFSAFRTLDAADLVKVHNCVSATPFDENFKAFWEQVRTDRNRIMHSVTADFFDPVRIISTILHAVFIFFDDMPWPRRLLQLEMESKFAAFGSVTDSFGPVMRQIDHALRHLEPAEAKRFLGLKPKQRRYMCPRCYGNAELDWLDHFPRLAQFTTKTPGAKSLRCLVCESTMAVKRKTCEDEECKGDVVADGMCLTCFCAAERFLRASVCKIDC